MKYSYLILLPLLLATTVEQGWGQHSASEKQSSEPQTIATVPGIPLPTDKVLGPGGKMQIRIGLFGGIISNSHSGAFTLQEEGILCCEFNGANSVGPTVALRGEYYPDANRSWGIAARVAWENQSAEFEGPAEQLLIFGNDNEPEDADFQNSLSASLTAINVAPLFMFKLIDLDLYISAGPAITFYSSPSFDKTEHILGPSGVTYLDGTTELVLPDVPIDGIQSTLFSFTAGLDFRYPITEKISIGSELYYRLPLSKISSDEEWSVSNVIATIGATLSL